MNVNKSILCFFGFAIATLQSGGQAWSEDGPIEPYLAYVAREGLHTRCGPSADFYQTDPLKAGQAVEVYLETDNGWLGIRPPNNSFCWLQSDQVNVADDESTGTVTEAGAVAWIGTHLGRARQYRWQVQLDAGEQVSIIGTAKRPGPEGDEVWYRIVPPSGEFRWIHESDLVDSPDLVEHRSSIKRERTLAAEDYDASQPASSNAASRTEVDVDLPVGSGLARRETAPRLNRISEDGFEERESSGIDIAMSAPLPPADDVQPTSGSSLRDWLLGGPLRKQRTPTTISADGLQPIDRPQLSAIQPATFASSTPAYSAPETIVGADLEMLRTELSRAMAAGARVEQVEPLRARCLQISQAEGNNVDRGRAALMLRRIEEYQQIARRRDGDPVPQAVASQPQTNQVGEAAETGELTRFDRQGQLVKVYSARPDVPPFALLDTAGQTLCYVTPVPGINLRRYLNQEVGLYGRMAFDTSLETPHLIAEQAVRLRR